jgi:thiol-disulfide isomerase/thioredoxin
MKKITIYIVMGLLCLNFRAASQSLIPEGALKIGDLIPKSLWDTPLEIVNDPQGRQSIKLADYKGKMILLDFWATWCSSCIHHLPDVKRLQSEFKKDLQVMLVNTRNSRDTKVKVINFFNRLNKDTATAVNLISVVNDVALDNAFYHLSIPHYVWINRRGVIKAYTSAEQVTSTSVRNLLINDEGSRFAKLDVNRERPTFTVSEFPTDKVQKFSLLLKGKVEGVGGGSRLRRINDTIRGRSFNNRTLVRLYTEVAGNNSNGFTARQLIVSAGDSSLLFPSKSATDAYTWERSNFYTYELIVPPGRMDHFYDDMLEDLNVNTGFLGSIEKREFQCLLLEKTTVGQDLPLSKGGKYVNTLEEPEKRLINAPVSDLVTWLNDQFPVRTIVINEAGSHHIDFQFKGDAHRFGDLQKNLSAIGLKLTPATYRLDCLVLKHKPSTILANPKPQTP